MSSHKLFISCSILPPSKDQTKTTCLVPLSCKTTTFSLKLVTSQYNSWRNFLGLFLFLSRFVQRHKPWRLTNPTLLYLWKVKTYAREKWFFCWSGGPRWASRVDIFSKGLLPNVLNSLKTQTYKQRKRYSLGLELCLPWWYLTTT